MSDMMFQENFTPLTKKSSTWDVMKAQVELNFNYTETGTIAKSFELNNIERDDDITDHLILNKMFPDVEVSFDEPMSLSKAEMINKNAQERKQLQQVIANGDDSFTTNALGFVSSLAPQIVDPIGIAVGLASGGAFKAAGITKALSLAMFKESTLLARVAENVAVNMLTEAAIVMPGQEDNREAINVYDNMVNAVVGGVALPVAFHGASKAFKWMKGLNKVEQFEKATNITEQKLEAGKTANISADEELIIRDGPEAINDPVLVREKANSIEQDMYYDKELHTQLEEADKAVFVDDVVKHSEEKFNEIETNPIMTEESLVELRAVKEKSVKRIESHDYIAKVLQKCIGG